MEETYFELPEADVGDMTFDESQKAIDKFEHQMKDPAHPLNPTRQSIDPRKGKFTDYRMKLYEHRAAVDDRPTEYDAALNEAAVKKQQEIDDIHAAGLRDFYRLKEYGYEGADPPDLITSDQARLFRMQVLNAEGTQSGINELGNMISQDMRKYNQTQELGALFNTLLDTELDADLRQSVGHKVIEYLDALRRDALAKKPTKQTNFNTFKAKHGIQGDIYG